MQSDILKCSVVAVAVEFADRRSGTITQLHRCAVDKINVRPTVIVEIKNGYPTFNRFEYVLFFWTSGGQVKVNVRCACHIHESPQELRGGRGDLGARSSGLSCSSQCH